MKKFFLTITISVTITVIATFVLLPACGQTTQAEMGETLPALAGQFGNPPAEYHPYVWWHWMGSNFSKAGITKDLEAMKEAGIGGATIFNLASAVQESSTPVDNNPWPEQTFRSEAYWEALRHAAAEAKRLGLKLGIHNTPGYVNTGGPWISEEQGMQTLTASRMEMDGGRFVETALAQPAQPVNSYGATAGWQGTFYRDVAVMAVPANAANAGDVVDLTALTDTSGTLRWHAPEGKWTVFRIGHAPTMASPSPLPDELIKKTLEVDKMSRTHSVYHWQQALNPLVEHLKEYIGDSFTHILIDSYEAGYQNWTASFREEFTARKGYDPLPWIALRMTIGAEPDNMKAFAKDYNDVVNRLFIENGWSVAAEMIHSAGLQFFWEPYAAEVMWDPVLWFFGEPYAGPFDLHECAALPDLPMGEFWTDGNGRIEQKLVQAAAHHGQRIVAAEAFTGRPEISRYTEDPAFLKHTADGSFASGANKLFLHHWVHQPFDDRYQPGMGMGWWGTHFGRHQTWIKPAKAFFTYLSRCQMLLQQGVFVSSTPDRLHRRIPGTAEIFFVINPSDSFKTQTYAFPVTGATPELWYADKGVIRRTNQWRTASDSTFVDLQLEADESVFVVFPLRDGDAYQALRQPAIDVINREYHDLNGRWNVRFEPKMGEPFRMTMDSLTDFSHSPDTAVRYFSGTAIYENSFRAEAEWLRDDRRIILDLGELHDIAELTVNGRSAGVLWYPPYKADITPCLKTGKNAIRIAVTNNWANRLIGDEQYPADFEWGRDRGVALGRAIKAFPDWFVNNRPRPSQGRKTFGIWYYHRQDSPLQPAGLLGKVRIVAERIVTQEKLAVDITGRWDTIRTLLNPDKGWYHHYMDNSLTQYGLESEAELDTFPSMHHLFIRIAWAYLEPEEGQFRWETIDTIVNRWAPKGYKLSLDITCKETMGEEMPYATPQWVEKAGAKGYMVNSWGTINWEPDYNDPVFLNKLDNFHRQMAERYDGAEWLSDVTTGSIGEWGEGHSSQRVSADVVIKHLEILLNNYKKTQLVIGDDYLNKAPEENLKLREFIKKHRIGYRDDSIFWEEVVKLPGSIRKPEFFEDVWRDSPITLEFCHYSYYKNKYWNVPDGYGGGLDIAKAAIRCAHATFVGFHGHLREWQRDNPKAARELVNLMGYWLFPQSMEAKWKHNRLGLSINWYNKGVAPAYTPYKLKIVLTGNDNREIALPAVLSGNEKWLPGMTKENYTIKTPPLHSGVYQVKIRLYKEFRNENIRPVKLGLATQYEDAEGFYHIGNITL